MAEMTVARAKARLTGTFGHSYLFDEEKAGKCNAQCILTIAKAVEDQRERWLAANQDASDDFKPLDQCTEADLLAELKKG